MLGERLREALTSAERRQFGLGTWLAVARDDGKGRAQAAQPPE